MCSFWCSLQRLSSGFSYQTSLFSKAELHLHSSTPRRSSHCPHLLTHYFTAPSSANPHRRITVTQCFTRQPLTSFSTSLHKSQRYSLHFSYLYIWFVGNSKVFRIFYIESRIGDEKFAFLFFFFFPFFFLCLMFGFSHLMFDGINPWWWIFNPWWWEFVDLLFFFVWFLGKHFIWSIETRGYGFSTMVNLCFSICRFFFFFFVWCLGKHLIWSTGFLWLWVYFILFL